jgi:hypothetical protein
MMLKTKTKAERKAQRYHQASGPAHPTRNIMGRYMMEERRRFMRKKLPNQQASCAQPTLLQRVQRGAT